MQVSPACLVPDLPTRQLGFPHPLPLFFLRDFLRVFLRLLLRDFLRLLLRDFLLRLLPPHNPKNPFFSGSPPCPSVGFTSADGALSKAP